MKRARGAVLAAIALCCAVAGAGQESAPQSSQNSQVWWQSALRHGTLTVWMVSKATTDDKLRIGRQRLTAAIQPSKVSVEKTTGEFGQTASTYGQAANTYGQTSGSFGTAASDTGQTAGGAGRSPSEVGANASTYGQTSSSYGQTSGSFGTAASNFGVASSDSNKVQPGAVHAQDAQQDEITVRLRQAFPALTVRIVQVTDLEVKDRLAEIGGTASRGTASRETANYPDVVIGVEYMAWWWQSGLGLAMLGEPTDTPYGDPLYRAGTIDLLRAAPHSETARAFWVWVSGAWQCADCGGDGTIVTAEAPVQLAQSALRGLLAGVPLGADADKDAAAFDVLTTQGLALAAYARGGGGNSADLKIRMETISAFAVGNLAAVSLRAVVSSNDAFGTLNALVVLRRASDGRWKVLQITPNQVSSHRYELYEDLRAAAVGKVTGKDTSVEPLRAVSLASPLDGETRPEHPELWWDNAGQARLQVVEWQTAQAGVWSASQLLAVRDMESRVQTKVTASFAQQQGAQYRWRVWSVGKGGALVLTGWRTFNVQGH